MGLDRPIRCSGGNRECPLLNDILVRAICFSVYLVPSAPSSSRRFGVSNWFPIKTNVSQVNDIVQRIHS